MRLARRDDVWLSHLVIICALSICGFAQTQDNAPYVTDSYFSAGTMNGGGGACSISADPSSCANFVEGANAQDLIVCAKGQQDITQQSCSDGSTNPSWTFTDSLSNTLTTRTAANPNTGQSQWIQMAYECVPSTQATFTVIATGWGGVCDLQRDISCVRIPNVCAAGSVTVDAFQSNIGAISGTGVTTVSNTLTTTRLNDIVVNAYQKAPGNGGSNRMISIGALSVGTTTGGSFSDLSFSFAPTLGSNTFSVKDYDAIHNSDVLQSLAFQIPIKLGDSALPQAAVGVVYSATLHPYGGTSATPTCNLISGSFPTGLSMTSCVISGTPSGSPGTVTLGFQVTDGSTTSATDTLTLNVASSFPAISVVGTPQIVNFDGGGGIASITGTACGDIVTLFRVGVDTHGGTGYKQTVNGTSNYVKLDDGSPVHEYILNSGVPGGPLVEDIIGPLITGGVHNLSVFNSTNASSALTANITVLRGAQAILDVPTPNTAVATANGTIAGTLVLPVANEYAQVATLSNYNAETITLSAPFTLEATGSYFYGTYAFGHDQAVSSGSITATTNLSNGLTGTCNSFDFCNTWTTLVSAVRPGSPTCQVTFPGLGEKHRRRSY